MQIPSTLTNYVPSASQQKQADGSIMGKDDFLNLLVTQLKYQDPENPVDNKDLTAQLAQFSSLEQMYKIGEGFEQLKSLLAEQSKFSLLQGVGKVARASGDTLTADAAGTGQQGFYTLAQASASTTVTISDAGGTVLRTLDLGAQSAGEHAFAWDRTLPGGAAAPAGTYRFAVTAADGSGEPIASATFIEGTVTGVSLGDSPTVFIAGIPVPFSSIFLWKGGEQG